jgi:uncharacterized protein YacL
MQNLLALASFILFFMGCFVLITCVHSRLASWFWKTPQEIIRSNPKKWFGRSFFLGLALIIASMVTLIATPFVITQVGYSREILMVLLGIELIFGVFYYLLSFDKR